MTCSFPIPSAVLAGRRPMSMRFGGLPGSRRRGRARRIDREARTGDTAGGADHDDRTDTGTERGPTGCGVEELWRQQRPPPGPD